VNFKSETGWNRLRIITLSDWNKIADWRAHGT